MENNLLHTDDLILSSLSGELDASGERELRDWMEADERNRARYAQIRDIWFASGFSAGDGKYDGARAFETFKKNTGLRSRNSRRSAWLWKVAAVAAAGALIFFLAFHGGQESVGKRFAPMVVEVPQGSTTRLTLPDGTHVQLNSESTLTYSQGFGVKDREVKLSGECFFEVALNADIPFRVASDHLAVQVMGTCFDFRDYPEDREASVSLTEGRVSLVNLTRGDTGIRFLNPGQQAVLDKQSGTLRIDSKDATHARLWTEGILFFDEVTLSDIARELERCYGVKIRIEDEIMGEMRIYGNFHSREQRIEDVLDLLTATHNLRYRKSGREISIF